LIAANPLIFSEKFFVLFLRKSANSAGYFFLHNIFFLNRSYFYSHFFNGSFNFLYKVLYFISSSICTPKAIGNRLIFFPQISADIFFCNIFFINRPYIIHIFFPQIFADFLIFSENFFVLFLRQSARSAG